MSEYLGKRKRKKEATRGAIAVRCLSRKEEDITNQSVNQVNQGGRIRDRPGILKRLDDFFLLFLFSFCVFWEGEGG